MKTELGRKKYFDPIDLDKPGDKTVFELLRMRERRVKVSFMEISVLQRYFKETDYIVCVADIMTSEILELRGYPKKDKGVSPRGRRIPRRAIYILDRDGTPLCRVGFKKVCKLGPKKIWWIPSREQSVEEALKLLGPRASKAHFIAVEEPDDRNEPRLILYYAQPEIKIEGEKKIEVEVGVGQWYAALIKHCELFVFRSATLVNTR